ncbi:hypothetical protein ETC03_12105 [Geobacillus sp. MMMUD3]|uniref:hypothetical protein n=1 Tax=Geobacillus kaustophilus TaxID=1462 RepID=UPI0005CCEB81|nr:hypothetical protein [Geobacillus kaustophilus]NNV07124.1 hypothetical protein [Geobacillus sp. MMMUD3]
MRKFEFSKAYEEVEINGKVYRIDFSDDVLGEYQKKIKQYYDESKELTEQDIASMSDDQQAELLAKQRQNMKSLTEALLGEGTFDELFEAAGRSTVVYAELLEFLTELFAEKAEKMKEDRRKKYVKKAR